MIIALWALRWGARTPRRADPGTASRGIRCASWGIVVATLLVSALATWSVGLAAGQSIIDPSLLFRAARVSIGATIAATLLVCAAWFFYRERRTATTLPRTSA